MSFTNTKIQSDDLENKKYGANDIYNNDNK